MKAHDRRRQTYQHCEHLRVSCEGRIDCLKRFGRGRAVFGEARCQRLQPRRFARRVGHWIGMDEQVDVERPVGRGADLRDVARGGLRCQRADGDGAQRPGIADRGAEGGCRGSRHRRLDQRQRQAEAFCEFHGTLGEALTLRRACSAAGSSFRGPYGRSCRTASRGNRCALPRFRGCARRSRG